MAQYRVVELEKDFDYKVIKSNLINDRTPHHVKENLSAVFALKEGALDYEDELDIQITVFQNAESEDQDIDEVLVKEGVVSEGLIKSFISRTTRFQFNWLAINNFQKITREDLLSYIVNNSDNIRWMLLQDSGEVYLILDRIAHKDDPDPETILELTLTDDEFSNFLKN